MTPEQIRAYATELIRDTAQDIDFTDIRECAEDSPHVPNGEITAAEKVAVHDEIRRAVVTVTWPAAERYAASHVATGRTAVGDLADITSTLELWLSEEAATGRYPSVGVLVQKLTAERAAQVTS